MMAQEKPKVLEYLEVSRKPNPMVNINPLARGSGKVVTLQDRLDKLQKSKVWQKAMATWHDQDKEFDMARMPKVAMVKLGDIAIDEDIQRALIEKWCSAIVNPQKFDPALMNVLQGIKKSDGQFVSIDGQHTASVIAGLIEEGFIQGNWQDFEFPLQYIETDDLAFARRAFHITNGKGTKKQSAYQSLRNDVFIVRIDGDTSEEQEVSAERQVSIAERHECFPVEENSQLLKYPGTFTNIATFKTLTDQETELACAWHNEYFHYENIHTALFFIFRDLNREFQSAKMTITKQLQFELAGIIQNLFGNLSQFAESTKEAHRRWGEKRYGYQPKWDDDAYMCGLIGLYKKFGGPESVPPSILDRMDDLVDFYDDDILSLA